MVRSYGSILLSSVQSKSIAMCIKYRTPNFEIVRTTTVSIIYCLTVKMTMFLGSGAQCLNTFKLVPLFMITGGVSKTQDPELRSGSKLPLLCLYLREDVSASDRDRDPSLE